MHLKSSAVQRKLHVCVLILINVPVSDLDCVMHLSPGENEGIQLRRNEKKLLNDINADKDGRLRFHILGDKGKVKKRIQTREEKIFILANDCLTGDPLVHDLSMSQVLLPPICCSF